MPYEASPYNCYDVLWGKVNGGKVEANFLVIRLVMSAIWGTANPIVVEPDKRDRECVASSAWLSPSFFGM